MAQFDLTPLVVVVVGRRLWLVVVVAVHRGGCSSCFLVNDYRNSIKSQGVYYLSNFRIAYLTLNSEQPRYVRAIDKQYD